MRVRALLAAPLLALLPAAGPAGSATSVVVTAVAPPPVLPATTPPAAVSGHGGSVARAGVVIAGTVRDARSGRPISGVRVRAPALGAGSVTDRTGSYRFSTPDSARGLEVVVEARRPGFGPQERTLRLRGDTVRADFALTPAVARELDAAVAPAADAHLRAAAHRPPGSWYPPGYDTESYDHVEEVGFRSPRLHPLSTFSADVDRASYANVRRFLTGGELPPVDAVRIEELVNYFSYDDPLPRDDRPFAARTEVAPAPWRPAHRLVRVGLRSPSVEVSELPPANLVFLVDVSGSMRPPNKLPLLKRSLRMLVDRLRPRDRVSLVVYAGAAGLVLEAAGGDEKNRILSALDSLGAGGSTAGGEGLRLAYDVAREHHLPQGNNRVILATDGDFNVGVSSDAAMRRLVEERRDQGTFLTVLGFGAGNTKFSKMEKIADHGNGQFHYIDGVLEAKKALVDEMGGTLLTVAKDVKLQVEFDPRRVAGYRLIGYENRRLDPEDFEDDTKDAGDVGAGHSVVAFYEVVPRGADTDVRIWEPDSLRYQRRKPRPDGGPGQADGGEIGWLKIRWKAPDGDESELMEVPIRDDGAPPGRAFRFGSAVVEFGLVLRGSEHRGDASLERALERAREARGQDPEGYRSEFVRLVGLSRELGAEGRGGPAGAGEDGP